MRLQDRVNYFVAECCEGAVRGSCLESKGWKGKVSAFVHWMCFANEDLRVVLQIHL